jgi:hypothetical protein
MKFRHFLPIALAVGALVGAGYSRAQLWSPFPHGTNATSGGGSCSQSTAWFTYVTGTIGATYDTTHHNATDALICGLVTDGVWAVLDAMWVPATNVTSGTLATVANTNLVNPGTFTLVPHGSPTLTADNGYTGGTDGGTTVYIDTGFNPSTAGGHFVQNSAHVGVWSNSDFNSAAAGAVLGGYDGTNYVVILPRWTGAYFGQINGSAGSTYSNTVPASTGPLVASRTGSLTANFLLTREGAVLPSSGGSNSTGLPNVNLYLLGNNSSGSAANGAPYLLSIVTLGGALNATTTPAISTSGTSSSGTGLAPRMCTYMTAIGSVSGGC